MHVGVGFSAGTTSLTCLCYDNTQALIFSFFSRAIPGFRNKSIPGRDVPRCGRGKTKTQDEVGLVVTRGREHHLLATAREVTTFLSSAEYLGVYGGRICTAKVALRFVLSFEVFRRRQSRFLCLFLCYLLWFTPELFFGSTAVFVVRTSFTKDKR